MAEPLTPRLPNVFGLPYPILLTPKKQIVTDAYGVQTIYEPPYPNDSLAVQRFTIAQGSPTGTVIGTLNPQKAAANALPKFSIDYASVPYGFIKDVIRVDPTTGVLTVGSQAAFLNATAVSEGYFFDTVIKHNLRNASDAIGNWGTDNEFRTHVRLTVV